MTASFWLPPLAGGLPEWRGSRGLRGLLAVILVMLALTLTACKTDLYTKLAEREANEMVALLIKHGISASRVALKDGTSTVQVDNERLADAIELLKASGLPRPAFANMGEVFKSSGLIASPTEERARFIYALSEELSRTLSDIDGVLSARIHVVLPKNDLLRQDATPASASVFIRHDVQAPLKTLLPHIKMLVANSIEGLSYEKVSVVLVPVDRTAAAETVTAGAGNRELASRRGTMADGELQPFHLAAVAATVVLILLTAGGAYWIGLHRRSGGVPMASQEAPRSDLPKQAGQTPKPGQSTLRPAA